MTYDLLTECAEARELPRMMVSISKDMLNIGRALLGRHSLGDIRLGALRPLYWLLDHPQRAMRKLGREWMQYRYGIMPLVYSYRDINKLLNRGFNTSFRKTSVIRPTPTDVSLPSASTSYVWKEDVGEILVRGNVFQHFDTRERAWAAGVGINPFVTAWELIPYSFVFDWFVNMGDYITAKTTTSFTGVRFACISTRYKYTTKTWQHFPNQDIVLTSTATTGNCNPSGYPAVYVTIDRPEESQLLQEVVYDNYDRYVWNLSDVPLSFNPSLKWRRLMDAGVMANNLLGIFNKRYLKQ